MRFKKYDIIIFFSIIVLAVGLWLGFLLLAKPGRIVEIIYNGNTLAEYKLGNHNSYTFENGKGGKNIIEINEDIHVSEANCPDGICTQKRIKNAGEAIVCVPNGLIVRVK